MMRRTLSFVVVLVAILASLSAGTACAVERPNVVLVMTDDQGMGDLAAHGHPKLETPTLDQLHDQSVRLHDFHVDPTCSETRAALMSGRYATRAHVWHTIMGRSMLPADEVTLAEMLKAAGYRTGHFGKWHLGDNYPLRPQDQGFDHVLRNGGGGVGQGPDNWGNDYFDDTYYQNGRPVTFRGFCTDVWFDNALEFIERNRNQPFFCYIPTNAAHAPFRAPDKYKQMYKEKGVTGDRVGFYGMLTNIDDNMQRLIDKLEALDLRQDTILIFTTDNGTARGKFNDGLRDKKGSHYDGGHRVPFMIHYPAGGIEGGRTVEQLTAHFDVMPTLANLCNAELPDRKLDGQDLTPLLTGQADDWPSRTLFVHSQRHQHPKKWRETAVMTEKWRLLDENKLYNIQQDRGQQNNVADQHPEVVKRLQTAYDQWWSSMKPSFDEYVRITIGSEHENPARLMSHDWHAPGFWVPWHQLHPKQFAKGTGWWEQEDIANKNGWWSIRVAKAGTYKVTLRHAPPEAAMKLNADQARLKIGEQEKSKPVPEGAQAVTFTLDLKPGKARMQTWLRSDSQTTRGAFYVYVERQ
jgi:arylsulfatase A-like enzyme